MEWHALWRIFGQRSWFWKNTESAEIKCYQTLPYWLLNHRFAHVIASVLSILPTTPPDVPSPLFFQLQLVSDRITQGQTKTKRKKPISWRSPRALLTNCPLSVIQTERQCGKSQNGFILAIMEWAQIDCCAFRWNYLMGKRKAVEANVLKTLSLKESGQPDCNWSQRCAQCGGYLKPAVCHSLTAFFKVCVSIGITIIFSSFLNACPEANYLVWQMIPSCLSDWENFMKNRSDVPRDKWWLQSLFAWDQVI